MTNVNNYSPPHCVIIEIYAHEVLCTSGNFDVPNPFEGMEEENW